MLNLLTYCRKNSNIYIRLIWFNGGRICSIQQMRFLSCLKVMEKRFAGHAGIVEKMKTLISAEVISDCFDGSVLFLL